MFIAKRINLFLICFLLIFSVIGEANASTWYASNSGSGTTCSSSTPCTVLYAINTKALAGDTVLLKDGTYTGTKYMVVPTKSGTNNSTRITIKAENDGAVTIDGQGLREPCIFTNVSYIDLEGVICQNPVSTNNYSQALAIKSSHHINIRRVSAYGLTQDITGEVVEASYSNNILFEDVFAAGRSRKLFNIISDSYVTCRRCLGRYIDADGSDAAGIVIYGTSNSVVENSIVTKDSASGNQPEGILIWTNLSSEPSNNNKVYGNVAVGMATGYSDAAKAYDHSNNEFKNNVSINSTNGFYQRGDSALTVDKLTVINSTNNNFYVGEWNYEPKDADYKINSTIKNSVFSSNGTGTGIYILPDARIGTITHEYNNLYQTNYDYYGNASHGNGEINVQPTYYTATYGNGAYLIKPSNLTTSGEGGTYMGAEVLYRYVDGTLTSTPLFPWPMEARICAETGYSVTYENGYTGCTNGGGLWKTLYPYSDITTPTVPASPADPYVNSTPVAMMTVNSITGYTVSITDASTDDAEFPTIAIIDWGDGTTSTGNNLETFSHTYATAGTFNIILKAMDAGGLYSSVVQNVVVQQSVTPQYVNGEPVAVMTINSVTGYTVSITDASTDDAAFPTSAITVNWGDGATNTGNNRATFSHNYATAGTFRIILTAMDADGLYSSVLQNVSVQQNNSITVNLSPALTSNATFILKQNGITKATGTGTTSHVFSNLNSNPYQVQIYKSGYTFDGDPVTAGSQNPVTVGPGQAVTFTHTP